MSHTKWIGLALLAAAGGSITAWALRTTPEVQVTTSPVTAGPITRRVAATGTLQAVTTVEVGAQVSGIVQSLSADFNSFVHAQQVIARLDPSVYGAQLRQAQAALAQAQAGVGRAEADELGWQAAREDAQARLTRAEALAAKGILTASDLDAARTTMDEATADLASGQAVVAQSQAAVVEAKAAVDQAAVNVEHTIIRSPIDGIVIDRSVDVGQTLAASVQSPVLFRIAADIRRMQVQVDIDEADVGGVTTGDVVSFSVESYPHEMFTGTLSQVRLQPVAQLSVTATTVPTSTSPAATSQVAAVVSYTGIVDVDNPDERLRPGMTAEVVLRGSREAHAIRIPNSALSFRPPDDVLKALGTTGGSSPLSRLPGAGGNQRPLEVWEYDGKRLTPIPVTAGLADDRWTELLSGDIRAGDTLVTSAAVQRRHRL